MPSWKKVVLHGSSGSLAHLKLENLTSQNVLGTDANGNVIAGSVSGYSLPVANSSTLGGIKVGNGLTMNGGTGVLSVNSNITASKLTITADSSSAQVYGIYFGTVGSNASPKGDSSGINYFPYTQTTTIKNLSVANNISVNGTVDGRDIAGDGTKLDGLIAQTSSFLVDTVYTLPIATTTALGGIKIGSGLTVNKTTGVVTAPAGTILSADRQNFYSGSLSLTGSGATSVTYSSQIGGFIISSTDTDTTYSAATTSTAGLMSSTDKTKLDGIAASANNYSLPIATASALGGIKIGSGLSINSETGVLSANVQAGTILSANRRDYYSGSLNLTGDGATTVTYSAEAGGFVISSTDTDTDTWRPLGTGATDAAAGNHTHDDRYLKIADTGSIIDYIVASAPGTLDTLNEIAAAIGDDANFSASIAAKIASKADANHTHDYLPLAGGTITRMVTAYTNLTNGEDWANSPISLRERDAVDSTQSADKYSPNLNFHWAGRVSKSLWMGANGKLNWGEYTAAGIPQADGTIKAATFEGALSGNATSATSATSASYAATGPFAATSHTHNYDNYGSWTISDRTNTGEIGSGTTLAVTGAGATSVSYDRNTGILTISSTDTDTNTWRPLGTGATDAAAGNHLHDDRYYTETEIDTKLAGYYNKTFQAFYVTGRGDTYYKVSFDVDQLDEIEIFRNYSDSIGGTDANWNNGSATHFGGMSITGKVQENAWGGMREFEDVHVTHNYTVIVGRIDMGDGAEYSKLNVWLRGGPNVRYFVRRKGGASTTVTVDLSSYINSPDTEYDNPYLNKVFYKDATLNIGGSIEVDGTVDGRDIATDGTKLDGIAANANNYSLPVASASVLGGIKVGTNLSITDGVLSSTDTNTVTSVGVTGDLTSGNITLAGSGATTITKSGGTITITSTDTDTTYSNATTERAGLMSTTDKTKLDGIAASANNYSLPLATSSVLGGVKIGYTASGKNYPVQLSNEQMYVNVPWTDTDTTYSDATTSRAGLMSTTDKSKLDGIAASANNYSLPVASASVLGGIKVGTNLSISEGVLSSTDTNTWRPLGTGATDAAAGNHTHDDRYYTETEVNSYLDGKLTNTWDSTTNVSNGFSDRVGGWNPSDDNYWDATLRSTSGRIYTDVSGRTADASGYSIDFAVPSGMKMMHISTLAWSNTGYFDVYGVKSNGTALWIKRINDFQDVQHESVSLDHAGSHMYKVEGVDRFTTIRLKGRVGRLHLQGVGWTKERGGGDSFNGFVHIDNVYSPSTILTSGNIGSYALTSLPSHTHDDRYYTETEVDTLLAGKQASGTYLTSLPSHDHDDRYFTETESDSRFLKLAGGTMTGTLTAPTIVPTLFHYAYGWRKYFKVRSVGVNGGSINGKWVHLFSVEIVGSYDKALIKAKLNGYDDVAIGTEVIHVLYENGGSTQENHDLYWYSIDNTASIFKAVKSIRTSASGLRNSYEVWAQMAGDWRDTFTMEVEFWEEENRALTFGTAAGQAEEPSGDSNDIVKTSRQWAVNSNLYIGGNITLAGTVDGRDIATDGTKLDGIAANANNYSLPIASASTLGGIKIGTNLSIDTNGVVSSTDTNTWRPLGTGATDAAAGNHTHDDRYYTETESDTRFARKDSTDSADLLGLVTVNVDMTLRTDWQATSIRGNTLSTGTYIVQVYVNDYAVGGGHYTEYYSGTMSWFGTATNSTVTDEIVLHRAGHAPNSGRIYLRTKRTPGANDGNMYLEMAGDTDNTGSSRYVFKFRRLI